MKKTTLEYIHGLLAAQEEAKEHLCGWYYKEQEAYCKGLYDMFDIIVSEGFTQDRPSYDELMEAAE